MDITVMKWTPAFLKINTIILALCLSNQPSLASSSSAKDAAYSANLSMSNIMFVHTMNDRYAHQNAINPSLWLSTSGGWLSTRHNEETVRAKSKYFVVRIGSDLINIDTNGMGKWKMGLMGSYGRSSLKTRTYHLLDANGLTASDAKGHINGYSVGLYTNWQADGFNEQGFYLDGSVQYNWFQNEINGKLAGKESYDSEGWLLTGEAGYGFKAYQGEQIQLIVKPRAVVSWSNIEMDDHIDSNNNFVTQDGEYQVITQAGVGIYVKDNLSANGHQGRGKALAVRPYIELDWLNYSRNCDVIIYNSSTSTCTCNSQDNSPNAVQLRLGADAVIKEHLIFWGRLAEQKGSKGYGFFNASVGIKWSF